MARAIGYSYNDYYKGYLVTVYGEYGSVKMCAWDKELHDWNICMFKTEADAQKAIDDYNDLWS